MRPGGLIFTYPHGSAHGTLPPRRLNDAREDAMRVVAILAGVVLWLTAGGAPGHAEKRVALVVEPSLCQSCRAGATAQSGERCPRGRRGAWADRVRGDSRLEISAGRR